MIRCRFQFNQGSTSHANLKSKFHDFSMTSIKEISELPYIVHGTDILSKIP